MQQQNMSMYGTLSNGKCNESSGRKVENDGLIKRVQYEEIPVRVEYSLTENCWQLFPAFNIIESWRKEMIMKSTQ